MTIPKHEFLSKVDDDGYLYKHTREAIGVVLKGYKGKVVKISIQQQHLRRSPKQNAYYWSVIVPHWKMIFASYGTIVTDDEVHAYLVAHIGKLFRRVVGPDGEPLMQYPENESTAVTLLRKMLAVEWLPNLLQWRQAAEDIVAAYEHTGEPVQELRSTSDLSTKEYTDFLEACRSEAATEHGHDIPPPDQTYNQESNPTHG